MNRPALEAAVIAASTAVILLAIIVCLAVGAWTVCRAIHAWATGQVEQRTWRASTRAPRTPTWATAAWIAEPAVAPPSASTPADTDDQDAEPDLSDPHCGTDEQLLQTVWDIWRQPTRKEDEK